MKSLTFLVPIFIDEFQILHDSGFVFVDRARISVASTENDDLLRPAVHCQIASSLPDLLPDAMHSVIIACFTGSSKAPDCLATTDPLTSSKACFWARDCCGLIPLTKRAREILRSRFDGAVRFTEPLFEEVIEKRFADREIVNAITGGNALVEVLVLNPDSFDFTKLPGVANTQCNDMVLVRKALKYTRYKPLTEQPIAGLRDLGGILKATLPNPEELTPPLKLLAEWVSSKRESATGFRRVYGDNGILGILDTIGTAWNLPVSAASLAIFLHWRYMSQRAQGLDLKALETDCFELAGCVPGQHLAEAIWLLGYSAGFDSFAGDYYAAQEAAHPFGAKRRPLKRILLLAPRSVGVTAPEVENLHGAGQMGIVPGAGEGSASNEEDSEAVASPTPLEKLDGDSQGCQPEELTDEVTAPSSPPMSASQIGSDLEDPAPGTIDEEYCLGRSNEPGESDSPSSDSPSIVDTPSIENALPDGIPQTKKGGAKRSNIADSGSKKASKPVDEVFPSATEPEKTP